MLSLTPNEAASAFPRARQTRSRVNGSLAAFPFQPPRAALLTLIQEGGEKQMACEFSVEIRVVF